MSCNSAIYTVNANIDVAADGSIPFGSIIRRFGRNIQLNGSDITVCGMGYYDVECSVSLTPVGAGDIGIQLYSDGMEVPGALATVTGTAGDTVTLSLTSLIRQRCNGASSLSLRLVTDPAVTTGATVTNVATVVTKV